MSDPVTASAGLPARCEPVPTARGGVGLPCQLAIGFALALAAWGLWEAAGEHGAAAVHSFMWWPILDERTGWIPWVPVSILAGWRWGWALLHWSRATLYRWLAFPRLRREAERAAAARGQVPELAVLAVTYKEDRDITRVVFDSVFEEVARVEGLARRPVVVAVTGSDEDDAGIRGAHEAAARRLPPERLAQLVLLRGTEGKRRALAMGLEWIRAWQQSPDGAYVMMDGDTHLEPGALCRSLCFLRLDPPIAAMTTDEHVIVDGPGWFAEWLHLRHGLRHLYTSSISLSHRLLCLTGRFSIFRADALDEGFIEIVRDDHVTSWLWGRYRLLSGDDKSTWYHLLSRGSRMLYLPDVAVVTHEIVRGSAAVRAYHNLRRWGGNMVRNSERAIFLGPRKTGLFIWWCLIDQRIAMWILLVGPLAMLMMVLGQRRDLAAAYLLWVIVSRTLRTSPAWIHGRRVSIVFTPLSALLDWAGAIVKIWVLYFPAKQFWLNRGKRELDSTARDKGVRLRRMIAGSLLAAAVLAMAIFVAWLTSTVQVDRDLALAFDELRQGAAGLVLLLCLLSLLVALSLSVACRLKQGASDV